MEEVVFWLLGVASLMRLGDYLLVRDLLIHIYYSDGSWGRPHAHSAAYARVRHLFPHTTASSCTLQELGFILLHNAVLVHLILFHCFFRTSYLLFSCFSLYFRCFVYTSFIPVITAIFPCFTYVNIEQFRCLTLEKLYEMFGFKIFFQQIPDTWSVEILNQAKNT